MIIVSGVLRHHAARLFALSSIVALLWMAQLPSLSNAEQENLAERFDFTRFPLPTVADASSYRYLREVNPSAERISAWISSVGAATALHDLDGDGLSNDICHVETRTDQVILMGVPGTPTRYQPFALTPSPLPYNARSMAPTGCLPGDFNEDGIGDLLVYYLGRTPVMFLGQGDQPFTGPAALSRRSYVAAELVTPVGHWNSTAATAADVDGDGHTDLIFGNYFQEEANLLGIDATGPVEMQHSMSNAQNGGRNRIFLWTGANSTSVQYRDDPDALEEQVALGWTLAIGAADLDGDLLPEIYFSNDFGPDRLLHNRSRPGEPRLVSLTGPRSFTTAKSKALGHDSFKGMGVDFGDTNGDGMLDIYVSNIADDYALEESHFLWVSSGSPALLAEGIAPYVDRSEQLGLSRSGWGWESRLADFDNDGVLEAIQATGFIKGEVNHWAELHELAMGNDQLISSAGTWPVIQPGDDVSGHQHTYFFVLSEDGRYYDLAPAMGTDDPQVTRGIATADVDGDGDLDYVVANQWETSYFYRNNGPRAGRFLGLSLLLPLDSQGATLSRAGHPGQDTPGRPAIGASALVRLPDGRVLTGQVDGGNGHSGARSPELHFGLGDVQVDTPLQVELSWRDAGGQIRQETLRLTPGWHTVLLGASLGTSKEQEGN